MAFDVSGRALHPLGEVVDASEFPLAQLTPAGTLDSLYYISSELAFDEDNIVLSLELAFEGELALTPPGTDVVSLVVASGGVGWTRLATRIVLGPDFSATFEDVTLGLRFREDILRDVATEGPAEISIGGDLRASPAGVALENFTGPSLAPAFVADTEVVVEAQDVRPVFGPIDPPGWLGDREDFEGLAIDELAVTVPNEYLQTDPDADLRIAMSHAAIDAAGFSGKVSASADPQHPITGSLLGFRFRFRLFELEVDKNTVLTSLLAADVRVQALETGGTEKWIGIEVGFTAGRSVRGALSAAQPDGASTDPGALVSYEVPGIMRLKLAELGVERRDGVWILFFSGDLQVLVGGGAISWPQVGFDELGIDSNGRLVSRDPGGIAFRGTMVVSLGYVKVTVGKFRLGFDPTGKLDFKPPTEVGVAIDSPTITGGGFLSYDERNDLFVGALQLELNRIVVSAVGIGTTRFPDGRRGLSLLVIISVELPPIQLGFGFTLNGVGGLLGANRGVVVEALRRGVEDRTLDPILFPRDPIGLAPTLGQRLGAVFPVERGRWIFGPMVKIGWGTPTVLTAEIALLLELPAPLRLIILGRLRVALPDPKAAIVQINLDAVGIIDFDRRELSVDASLYDSKVGPFTLTGDMAARANWGEQPDFAVALGGFHPAYKPTPGFPVLRRLALALSTGDNPRLRMEAYLALTSNTIQVGARLDFYVAVAGFSLEGGMGFDTLITLSPFRLQAEIDAGLTLKRGSNTLAHLGVHVNLVGPAPWEVWGEARITILLLDIKVPFRATFGRPEAAPELERVAVWPLLHKELSDPTNWSAQLPPEGNRLATLAGVAADSEALVHPLGTLSVTQRRVPLERTLSLFGTAPPKDFNRFDIAGADGLELGADLYDYFAPAQFRRMTDAEKLSSPSFDRMVSGAKLGPKDGVRIGNVQDTPLDYETAVVLDLEDPARERLGVTYAPTTKAVASLAERGAVAQAGDEGREKFATDGTGPAVAEPEYVVATRDTLDIVSDGSDGADGSYSSALEALRRHADSDGLQIVRREEAELAAL